ncbi:hypothetical protein [Lysobacter enzymogenes]|uniref:hypothetical protein n=1 Tax=Lysobacter enzymogenes TaxID=69 RepID=UPI00099BB95E|nr:hypothetical protein [Lysobacter enzymogenes]UZW59864.1 hypothetical protein BV903_021710 [Lysobacter enzymogenes]
MPATAADIQGQGATLHAEFAYDPAQRGLRVSYRLRNTGDAPLAVFDRGDRHQAGIGRQTLGAVASPALVERDGDVEFVHAAQPLSVPAPTSPPTPLAMKLAPGATLSGRFEIQLWSKAEPKRLRWCLGVMPFEASLFHAPAKTADGEVWSASFSAADTQQMLCTPWFDVAKGAFAA